MTKIGDDQKNKLQPPIESFVVPPPQQPRNILSKREVPLSEIRSLLFPNRPAHSHNCFCGLCYTKDGDEVYTCRDLGCTKLPYPPCRHGCCQRHHNTRTRQGRDCKPLMELVL